MEVMVALVIFSILSVGAFGVLTGLRRSQASLDERSALRIPSAHAPVFLPRHQPSHLCTATPKRADIYVA